MTDNIWIILVILGICLVYWIWGVISHEKGMGRIECAKRTLSDKFGICKDRQNVELENMEHVNDNDNQNVYL